MLLVKGACPGLKLVHRELSQEHQDFMQMSSNHIQAQGQLPVLQAVSVRSAEVPALLH